MIRVNLLRNMGMSSAGTGIGTSIAGTGELVSVDIRRQAAVKAVIILMFPVMLFIWEKLRINNLQSEKAQFQQKVDLVEAEKASFGSAAPRVEKANKLKERIESEIKVIQKLAKNRLREVKALDQLQSVLPAGTWLSELTMDGGKILLEGYALNEGSLTELLTALDGNVFFSMVQPKGTSLQNNEALGSVTKFSIEFRVGRQEDQL
jgi:Tfp pilus assembly protein PilN